MSEIKVNKLSPRTNCGTTQLGDAGDTITVTGDLKSNSIKSASGSTLTIGQSGDTVTLASGANQSGFGRTGTVDWDTTAKTSAFTAVSGNGYFVNTTSAAITVTLPASPSAGDIISIADYANTADTNNITIARNGSPIEGGTNNHTISAEGGTATLIYVDGTQGWRPVHSANSSDFPEQALFTAATGGTVTTCGDFKIHTFTSPGTFTVSSVGNVPTVPLGGPNTVNYMIVAGGGGGGNDIGGGGGAGGFREGKQGTDNGTYTASPLAAACSGLPVSVQAYPITVGGGGSGRAPGCSPAGTQGSNSIFSTITSSGGGAGNPSAPIRNGGSGSGNGHRGGNGGSGNTPPVSTPTRKFSTSRTSFRPWRVCRNRWWRSRCFSFSQQLLNLLFRRTWLQHGGAGSNIPSNFIGPTSSELWSITKSIST